MGSDIRCFLCGSYEETHVCDPDLSTNDDGQQKIITQEDGSKNADAATLELRSSPMPLARKGQAPDSISIIQEKVRDLEDQILDRREETAPLTVAEACLSLAREAGQVATQGSMIVRPTVKNRPSRQRLAEELCDTIIQVLAVGNAAKINIASFMDSRLNMYFKGVDSGIFDKPEI